MQRVFLAALISLAAVWQAAAGTASTFKDVFGKVQTPFHLDGKEGSVLIFYWHDCPICTSYIPEINRLRADFPQFGFYLVEVDPDWGAVQARGHIRDFGIEEPVLLDADHRLVNAARATVTPEAVVFGGDRAVLYRGRIDNTYADLGIRRSAATRHDLRAALQCILAGKAITSEAPALGCAIPELSRRN